MASLGAREAPALLLEDPDELPWPDRRKAPAHAPTVTRSIQPVRAAVDPRLRAPRGSPRSHHGPWRALPHRLPLRVAAGKVRDGHTEAALRLGLQDDFKLAFVGHLILRLPSLRGQAVRASMLIPADSPCRRFSTSHRARSSMAAGVSPSHARGSSSRPRRRHPQATPHLRRKSSPHIPSSDFAGLIPDDLLSEPARWRDDAEWQTLELCPIALLRVP